MSAASVMLSFRTMFSPERAGDAKLTLLLILAGVPHRARVRSGQLDIEIGEIADADVTVEGDPNLLAAIVYGGMSVRAAKAKGLKVTGDPTVLQRFATFFPLPEKAVATGRA